MTKQELCVQAINEMINTADVDLLTPTQVREVAEEIYATVAAIQSY